MKSIAARPFRSWQIVPDGDVGLANRVVCFHPPSGPVPASSTLLFAKHILSAVLSMALHLPPA